MLYRKNDQSQKLATESVEDTEDTEDTEETEETENPENGKQLQSSGLFFLRPLRRLWLKKF